MKRPVLLSLLFLLCTVLLCSAQRKKKSVETSPSILKEIGIGGLKFRNVGPAITSGRISDFAVNPDNPKEYYVATSAGGVWKTINGGTTYQPLFDAQGSYSIGVVELDPNNPNVIWVGTGENNNQRSVAYGDGVYKSEDGGKSWKNVGLKTSEHIGKIVIDPRNSNVVYVAAIGPLWKEGGERGLYKTSDGGKTWKAVLTVDAHTGINEIVIDPRNPDVLYAAAHQRRRHVFTYIGGGPSSGLYKSTDAGESWVEINSGLPKVDIGRIGLAISPADPEIIYAIVEAAQGKGGFFKSTDRGASWSKQGGYATSGNYYQEIVPDPIDPDKIYAMDTWLHFSVDGGKTFKVLGEDTKHVDNHCMWIDPTDTDHFLVGCDGGIYESFDAAKTWHYKPNLPVTQFYKVALDNDLPFYNIYGGTQDNFSMGGPSRTISANGIPNSDWFMTHGGDGFESQVDPKNPDIVYAQSQYGFLVRYDRKSGEEVGIKPKERKGEAQYRWNWDAPLAVSTHKDGRIYFAANKLFKSNDRGNSWEVISDDLTQSLNRNELAVMGRVWGPDAVMKNASTSPYGTIVAFSESPKKESLLYVGTDDGLIQVTEDGGKNWRKTTQISGVPARTYVNAIWASQHDENVVYAAFNHHKYGDFKPYVFKSSDKGRSWSKVAGNLPERGSVYCIAEDHVDKNLLFVGTEFGVFFTIDGGKEWKQLKAGVPTVAIRDIAIHQREDDLVLGSFGRGFFVLDDYSSLRDLKGAIGNGGQLFAVRDPLLYEQKAPLGLPGKSFQGDAYYTGENLPSVAMFTYYLKDAPKTLEAERLEREKDAKKENKNGRYPSYKELEEEKKEDKPYLLFNITDAQGKLIKKIKTDIGKGINRIQWDLRYPSENPISLSAPSFYNPFAGKDEGTLVLPGKYAVTMSKVIRGISTQVGDAVSFEVKSLNNNVLPAADRVAKVAFQRKVNNLSRSLQGAQRTIGEVKSQLRHLEKASWQVELSQDKIAPKITAIERKLEAIEVLLNSDPIASTLDKDVPPTVGTRVGIMVFEQYYSTAAPTTTHLKNYEIAVAEFKPLLDDLKSLVTKDLQVLQDELEKAGAPYTPYRLPEFVDN